MSCYLSGSRFSSTENCAETIFYGTDYHSHLGTEYGGIAVLGEVFKRQIHNLNQSQFKAKFYDDYKSIKGNKGIGVISDYDEQPIYLNSRFGPFCIVTSGFVENAEEIAEKLLRKGISFSEVSKRAVNTPELIAKLINQGNDLSNGIEKMFEAIKGSCSLLLLHKDGIYAARDRFGYTPLIAGKRPDAWAVTAETSAFPNNGLEVVKHVEPGEIILINEDGIVQRRPGGGNVNQICAFLWIYAGFPASNVFGFCCHCFLILRLLFIFFRVRVGMYYIIYLTQRVDWVVGVTLSLSKGYPVFIRS